jgi:prolyl 4-hydroxylase
VKEYKFNTNNNFIDGYYLSDLSICDDLIKLFKNSNNKVSGESGRGTVNKKIKDSLDLQLWLKDIIEYPILDKYFQQLSQALEIYKKKYKFCDENVGEWGIQQDFNIQKYKPSQAYHCWHCEHTNIKTSKRHLVFMTYLNDVKKGGETEWYYQKLKIKPQKGLTVIWSGDWTFTHKGHTTIDEDKYIITGWYEFKN